MIVERRSEGVPLSYTCRTKTAPDFSASPYAIYVTRNWSYFQHSDSGTRPFTHTTRRLRFLRLCSLRARARAIARTRGAPAPRLAVGFNHVPTTFLPRPVRRPVPAKIGFKSRIKPGAKFVTLCDARVLASAALPLPLSPRSRWTSSSGALPSRTSCSVRE